MQVLAPPPAGSGAATLLLRRLVGRDAQRPGAPSGVVAAHPVLVSRMSFRRPEVSYWPRMFQLPAWPAPDAPAGVPGGVGRMCPSAGNGCHQCVDERLCRLSAARPVRSSGALSIRFARQYLLHCDAPLTHASDTWFGCEGEGNMVAPRRRRDVHRTALRRCGRNRSGLPSLIFARNLDAGQRSGAKKELGQAGGDVAGARRGDR
jgi:hypothetical protein